MPGALATDRRLDIDPAELGGVADGVDTTDPAPFNDEADRGVVAVVGADDASSERAAVMSPYSRAAWRSASSRERPCRIRSSTLI
jgi:hypothetical protein